MGQVIKIWTSYYAGLKGLPGSIIPISIAGRAPEGWKGLEYKKAAPKAWFFKEWKEKRESLGDTYYVDNYKKHVTGTLDPIQVLKDLLIITGGKTELALACYEKPGDFCHRHLFYDWLKDSFEGNPGIEFMGEWRKEED